MKKNQLAALFAAAVIGVVSYKGYEIVTDPDIQYKYARWSIQNNDHDTGIEWLERSAAQNNLEAKYELAKLYELGKGVSIDLQKAARLYEEISNFRGGYLPPYYYDFQKGAKLRLARMYEEGRGVEIDYKKAIDLYGEVGRLFYDKDYKEIASSANYRLGRLHEEGKGVKIDYMKAISYYNDTIEEDRIKAKEHVKLLFLNNDIEPQYTSESSSIYPSPLDRDINSRENVQKWLEEAAHDGDAMAQYNLGRLLYREGNPYLTPKNPKISVALEWFEKASYQGHKKAAQSIGEYYSNYGIEMVSVERAQAFYESLKDNTALQIEAGDVFSRAGHPEKAIEWYGKAAGNKTNIDHAADAQYKIGMVYDDEMNNPTKAMEWYKKAIESKSTTQSVAEAHFRIGLIHERKREYKQALSHYEKTVPRSKTGNSIYRIGRIYEDVIELQNYDQAWYWYAEAYNKHKHPTAAMRLARIVDEGRGGYIPNYPQAKGLYEVAANATKPEPLAVFGLGRMYEEGRGVAQNLPEAIKWYTQAADLGVAEAQLNLGRMYHFGKGFSSSNYNKARELYERAAAQGNALAMNNLGVLFVEGKGGVERNYTLAKEWYQRAADRGVSAANRNLALLEDLIKSQDNYAGMESTHASPSQNREMAHQGNAVRVKWGKQTNKVHHRYFNNVSSRNTRYLESHQSYEVAFESGDSWSLGGSVGIKAILSGSITKSWMDSAEAKLGHTITEGASAELDGTACDKWKLVTTETWKHGTVSSPHLGVNTEVPFSMMVFHELNAYNLCDAKNKHHLPKGP